MKQRFTALDCSAIVSDLRKTLVGLRLQNVYDINQRTFLLKFALPDSKHIVLIESGTRIHTTTFARDKNAAPSHFASKLRKFLKTRRLSSVRQLGMDRVIVMTFGDGEFAYHLIMEFFASGNIILTDHLDVILAILRVVDLPDTSVKAAAPIGDTPSNPVGEQEIIFRVGEKYRYNLAKPHVPTDADMIREALTLALIPLPEEPVPLADVLNEVQMKSGKKGGGPSKKNKFERKKAAGTSLTTLKKLLRDKFSPIYGPALVDHALAVSKCDGNMKIDDEADVDSIVTDLSRGFSDADAIIDTIANGRHETKGYITCVIHKDGAQTDLETYDDFAPYLFEHMPKTPEPVVLPSFNAAVDTFFSRVESQKLALRARQAEMAATKKLENVKQGHANQVAGLERSVVTNSRFAAAVERNLDLVDSIITTIRSLLDKGMDWIDLKNLVTDEARKGNDVAAKVKDFKLESGCVVIELLDPEFEDADDDGNDSDDDDLDSDDDDYAAKREATAKRRKEREAMLKEATLSVEIDVNISAYANAAKYYGSRKVASVKVEKTLASTAKALKTTEKKIAADLSSTIKKVATIKAIRPTQWFEKFIWFISSENYLCVAGRDSMQNELLLKKYMKKGDVVVSCDVAGAPLVLVKNPYQPRDSDAPPGLTEANPVPPLTLHQAGTLSVVHSKAWDGKIVVGAWWTLATNVTGYGVGGLIFKGDKSHLPPVQLVFGFGLLFRLDEASTSRHRSERRPWLRFGDAGADITISTENWRPEVEDQASGATETAVVVNTDDATDDVEIVDSGAQTMDDEDGDDANDADDADDADEEAVVVMKNTNDESGRANSGEHEEGENQVCEDPEDIAGERSLRNDSASVKEDKGKVRYLTAKQRRDMQKGRAVQSSASNDNGDDDDDDEGDAKSVVTNSTSVSRATTSASVAPLPRGKRSKLKKAREKYAEQDDEERELMMSVLGSTGTKSKKSEPQSQGKPSSAGRKPNANPASTQPKRIKEEGVIIDNVEADSEPKRDLQVLDSFTSMPLDGDVIDACIPVCAPWACLAKYKYKIKLIPGPQKRGKAAMAAMHAFMTMHLPASDALAPIERDLMAAVPETETVNVMLGKVKMMASSGDGKPGGGGDKAGKKGGSSRGGSGKKK